MSIGQCVTTGLGHAVPPPIAAPPRPTAQPLHRLATVRRLQGISRGTMARRLNIDLGELAEQERETTDVPLSVLYAWQKTLEVPIGELLVETDDALSLPVLRRSQLLRLMKTVLAVAQHAKQICVRRMAETMAAQLIEIMPELAHVSPWHAVGKRRRLSELGIAAERQLSDEIFVDRGDD
jgi:transcriptional regulator with XRE-family HTH domain